MPQGFRNPCSILLFFVFTLLAVPVVAQSTAFTYQGKLTNSGNLPTADYDMQFKLFDALSDGTQIGATLTFDGGPSNPPPVSVSNGIFAVTLDFGTCPPPFPCFNGNPRFLEIAVRVHGVAPYVT